MPHPLPPEIEALKSSLGAKGVKYALASYVNIHSVGKAKMVPVARRGQILVAGLGSIAEGLDPSDPHTENMYDYSLGGLKRTGIDMLPRTLQKGINAFEVAPLSRLVIAIAPTPRPCHSGGQISL